MKSIAFLGAKNIGLKCLEFLNGNKQLGNYSVDAVFTNLERNAEVNNKLIKFAEQNNIKVYGELDELLDLPPFDVIISIQYHKILKAKHIARAKQVAINLHMAPLPEYRGCNQFSFAIVDGKKEFGTTIHVLEEGIDSGAIIAESRFPVPGNCFVNELVDITFEKSVKLFEDSILDIIANNYISTPQGNLIAERGTTTIYRKDIAKLKEIDLNWDKEKIDRHIRATLMPSFEPPYTMVGDKKIYFTLADQ